MNKSRYIALLRGINVGGNNIIKMADLKRSFESMSFTDVQTYIASGNVLFSSELTSKADLEKTIEEALSKAFAYDSRVVLLSAEELEKAVTQAPAGFGGEPDQYRYDVLFVKEPATTAEALKQVSTKDGVDEAHAGAHALYFRRLTSKASQSHLAKLIKSPIYQRLTVRNWNTTTKLLALAKGG